MNDEQFANDWNLIHAAHKEYRERHKDLVLDILSNLPPHTYDNFIEISADCNSPYLILKALQSHETI